MAHVERSAIEMDKYNTIQKGEGAPVKQLVHSK